MAKKRKLFEILDDNLIVQSFGDVQVGFNGLRLDSRKVTKNDVYFAIKGFTSDGHDYIESAIANGARVIVCENTDFSFSLEVTVVQVSDARSAMAHAARCFYDDPSSKLKLVGVTGTNGKTTVCTLLWQLFSSLGYKVGLISTVENKIGDSIIPATHTTPDVISLNALLAEMVTSGCAYAFMEVSSHALDQRRNEGVQYTGGVFTNMSQDHLDYHKTFKEYIWAKKKFFDSLPKAAFSCVNVDDKRGEVMVQNTKSRILKYALKSMADYKGKILSNTVNGLSMMINNHEAHFRQVGEFNAYNLLAVYAAATELGISEIEILTHLSNIKGAEGRFENIKVPGVDKIGIVDYAHTPDALENVLKTIGKIKSPTANIITVVGCGGDRDAGKRPLMAKIAARLSAQFILTSDNPRTENPETILDHMVAGLDLEEQLAMIRITSRKEAIQKAVEIAGEGDIILIAGKGHEKYQDINGVKTPFDDKKVLTSALQGDT